MNFLWNIKTWLVLNRDFNQWDECGAPASPQQQRRLIKSTTTIIIVFTLSVETRWLRELRIPSIVFLSKKTHTHVQMLIHFDNEFSHADLFKTKRKSNHKAILWFYVLLFWFVSAQRCSAQSKCKSQAISYYFHPSPTIPIFFIHI